MNPLRVEISLSITEDPTTNRLTVFSEHIIKSGTDVSRIGSTASIAADQLFTRLSEVALNQLRVVCTKMEQTIKQRKQPQ